MKTNPLRDITTTHPTQATTGIVAGTALAAANSNVILPGKTYTRIAFTGQLDIRLTKGQSATLINCRIDAAGASYCIDCHGNLGAMLIQQCELVNSASCFVYGENFTARANYLHASQGDGFKPVSNAVIVGNYLTDIGLAANSHADGVQIRGGTNIVITGNTFDTAGSAHCNSNLFCQLASSANITFSNNFCSGGNYAISVWDSTRPASISVTGNVFVKGSQKFGVLHVMPGVVATGNTLDDGTPVLAKARTTFDPKFARVLDKGRQPIKRAA